MRRLLSIAALSLALSPALAQDKEKKNPERAAVEEFLKKSLETNRKDLEVGGLKVRVTLVPNYLHVVLAREFLKYDHTQQSPKFVANQLAALHKKVGKKLDRPGIIARFEHPEAGGRNLMAFEGVLPQYIRVVSKGVSKTKFRVLPVEFNGPEPAAKTYRLFKPSQSQLFSAQVSSSMKMRYSVFAKGPFTIEGVFNKAFKKRDTKVAVAIGGFAHITGQRGIAGTQIDFSKGAKGIIERGDSASFGVPLPGPKLPKILAGMIPKKN